LFRKTSILHPVDAFGGITWINATFAVKAGTDFAWNRALTEQVLDGETGLKGKQCRLLDDSWYNTPLQPPQMLFSDAVQLETAPVALSGDVLDDDVLPD
jgi:hypothetical protein